MPTGRSVQSAEGVWAQWTNQAVILQVKTEDSRIALRGAIIGESASSIRFRLDDSWDIDIYKHLILAVEEDSWMDSVT